jgi:hypothetical protein
MSLYPHSLECPVCFGLLQYGWANYGCRCPDQHDAHVTAWLSWKAWQREAAFHRAARDRIINGGSWVIPAPRPLGDDHFGVAA